MNFLLTLWVSRAWQRKLLLLLLFEYQSPDPLFTSCTFHLFINCILRITFQLPAIYNFHKVMKWKINKIHEYASNFCIHFIQFFSEWKIKAVPPLSDAPRCIISKPKNNLNFCSFSTTNEIIKRAEIFFN